MYKLISASSILIFLLFLLPACNKSATTTSPSSNNSSGNSTNNNNGGNNNNGNNGGNTTPTYGFSVKIDGVTYTSSSYRMTKAKSMIGLDMLMIAADIPYRGKMTFNTTVSGYAKVKKYVSNLWGDSTVSIAFVRGADSSSYTPTAAFYFDHGNDTLNITTDNGTYVSGTLVGTFYKDTTYNGVFVKPSDSFKVTEGKFTIKY